MKIEQRLVKISEAKSVIEKAAERVKGGATELKESLAKNIETVKLYKGQEGVSGETVIPLMVEVEETPAEANATILKELVEIKKSVGDLKPSIDALKKETSATNTLALVNETIEGLIAGLNAIKTKANSGTGITPDELSAAWPGYETRELISGLMATLNNMQKVVDVYKEMEPSLAAALKKSEDGDGEPGDGGDGGGEGAGNADSGSGNGQGGDDGGDDDTSGDRGKTDGEPSEDDDAGDEDESMANMDLSPPLEPGGSTAEDENVVIEG